jgi:hypothetical protein
MAMAGNALARGADNQLVFPTDACALLHSEQSPATVTAAAATDCTDFDLDGDRYPVAVSPVLPPFPRRSNLESGGVVQ